MERTAGERTAGERTAGEHTAGEHTAVKPLVIARGGASAEAPEHTIAAFEAALAEGADALALRVRLSRDGHPVAFGPATLERTTDGRGPVGELTVRELKRLDAGGWKGSRFKGQRVQTLQEVLERFRDRTRFWIELPDGDDAGSGIEERVISTLEIYEVDERCLVQSANREALGRVRTLNPAIPIGALWSAGSLASALPAPGTAEALCPAVEVLQAGDVEKIRAAGLGCYVWTVNEPALADRLVGWCVDGILTDRPGLMRACVGRA
jgi:glycerophosphoryl diester phosphodiesterase